MCYYIMVHRTRRKERSKRSSMRKDRNKRRSRLKRVNSIKKPRKNKTNRKRKKTKNKKLIRGGKWLRHNLQTGKYENIDPTINMYGSNLPGFDLRRRRENKEKMFYLLNQRNHGLQNFSTFIRDISKPYFIDSQKNWKGEITKTVKNSWEKKPGTSTYIHVLTGFKANVGRKIQLYNFDDRGVITSIEKDKVYFIPMNVEEMVVGAGISLTNPDGAEEILQRATKMAKKTEFNTIIGNIVYNNDDIALLNKIVSQDVGSNSDSIHVSSTTDFKLIVDSIDPNMDAWKNISGSVVLGAVGTVGAVALTPWVLTGALPVSAYLAYNAHKDRNQEGKLKAKEKDYILKDPQQANESSLDDSL